MAVTNENGQVHGVTGLVVDASIMPTLIGEHNATLRWQKFPIIFVAKICHRYWILRLGTRLEFFFDISSPWTYLAFSRIEALAERMQAELVWRPILVGGVFNSVNQELYETRANPNKAKLNYSVKDIKDWADFCGVEINWPDIFPVNAVNIMELLRSTTTNCRICAAWFRGLLARWSGYEQSRYIVGHC